MKKGLLFFILMACILNMHASTEDTIKSGRKTDNFYLQLYGGINKSANENLPWTEFSSYPWSHGAFVGIGREITPLWGWRMALRYNHNKSRNVQECESQDTWGWDNVGIFTDATFDLSDFLTSPSSDKRHRMNIKLFAGVGGAYTFGFPHDKPLSYSHAYSSNSAISLGLRAGMTATYRLTDNWRIGAELSHTMFTDRFNGVSADMPLDGRSNLSVGLTYMMGKTKKKQTAPPVILDHRLKTASGMPYMMPDPESVKHRFVTGCAFLDFPVNETVIYPDYRRNPEELRRIRATIDSALFDKTIQVQRIYLHGYASPESPFSNNTRLAKGRTAALKEYILKKYNLSASVFRTTFTPEDWENLRNFIADRNRRRIKGDVWYENAMINETPETPEYVLSYRNELLDVIDKKMDLDEKEELLKKVGDGKPYQWLLKHVYPGLRHTDYVIEYIVRQYPVKEARDLIYTHPEALSLNEMYSVALSYETGSDGWLDALLIAANQYPDDKVANLNAACACVEAKRLTDAKRFAAKAGNTVEANYVRNVIKAMEGKVKWENVDGQIIVKE